MRNSMYMNAGGVIESAIATAIRALAAGARDAYARHRQRREARVIRDALHELDDRTLQDLGLNRNEIASIAAEATGQTECTRIRVLQGMYGVPH
jgi:uncharacterized protein YjiS (DUF1127 family)